MSATRSFVPSLFGRDATWGRVPSETRYSDVDGDGRPDLLFAEMHQGRDPDEVGVLLNRGPGWVTHVLATGGSHGVQPLDVDGDGDVDVFGANWSGAHQPVELWQNLGSDPRPRRRER